jgi:hypothetical protein
MALWLSMVVAASAALVGTQSFTIFGVDAMNAGLNRIDFSSGDSTLIGPLDPKRVAKNRGNRVTTPIAMAIRPSDGAIFVWNNIGTTQEGRPDPSSGGLYLVDPATGEGRRVGGQGQTGALSFGPDGTLYKVGDLLSRLDVTTGNETPIGPTMDEQGRMVRVHGADMDPLSGVVYATGLYPPVPWTPEAHARAEFFLFKVDLSSGRLTTIGSHQLTPGSIVGTLFFTPDGSAHGTSFSTKQAQIFRIDTSTGRGLAIIRQNKWIGGIQGMGVVADKPNKR